MFKLVGVAVALYVVYALSRGEVFAKHGIWGVTRKRDEQPVQFWSTIVIYTMLSAALDYWRTLDEEAKAAFRFHHISTDEVFGTLADDGFFTEGKEPQQVYMTYAEPL